MAIIDRTRHDRHQNAAKKDRPGREPVSARIRLRRMFLRPVVNLEQAAAMLGIRTWHPDDDEDLEVLAALLTRRTAIAAAPRRGRPQDLQRAREVVDRLRAWDPRL